MAKVKQLSAFLPNRPGSMAGLCTALAKAKVNIIALSVVESADQGIVRMIVNKPAVAMKVLAESRLPFQQNEVLLLKLPNKVGVLAKVTARLAAKKVNINYVYGSTGTGAAKTHVVLAVDRMPTALKALARI